MHTKKTKSCYYQIKQRCYNPKNPLYKYYGARGISICDSWIESIDNFVNDMGEWPDALTLDRIDSNGNYEPSNCRWATMTTQNRNRRILATNISGSTGVSWSASHNMWRAQITVQRKSIYLGDYKKLEDAVLARKAGEIKYWS